MSHRGGTPPPLDPPLQTKVTIKGNNEIYKRENLVGPFFWYTDFWVPDPPPPLLILPLPAQPCLLQHPINNKQSTAMNQLITTSLPFP